MPSRAGRRVIAASMVTATITAVAQPIAVIIGIPDTCSPTIATMTVRPAKSTDSPAVAFARPTATGTGMPSAMFWRCRLKMNKA